MNDLTKNLLLWVVVAVVLMVVFQSFSPKLAPSQEVVYSQFVQEVQDDRIKKVDISSNERTVKFERADGSTGTTTAPVRDQELISDLINHKVEIKQAPPDTGVSFWSLVLNFLPVLLIIGFWLFMMRQMQGGGGGKGAMSFGKSRAKLLNEDQVKVTFADVAGCDEAKEEVSELVDFLRDPQKFQRLGGKIQAIHLARYAVVYVRQSTMQQVDRHQESTRLQYALVDRAVALGWSRAQVLVIDEDQGRSGSNAEGRPGFQRLVAEVGLNHVGLVLGTDMSRLARSSRDRPSEKYFLSGSPVPSRCASTRRSSAVSSSRAHQSQLGSWFSTRLRMVPARSSPSRQTLPSFIC